MLATVDIGDRHIHTQRLILRPWQMSDLDDLYEYAKCDGVGQLAGWMPHKNKKESRAILEMFIKGKKTFAVTLKDSGKVIGSIGIEEMRPDPVTQKLYGREIGYVLSKEYWGRGLMTEGVSAVIRFCFEELGYDYLTCCHFIYNDRSRRVIEKCGFKFLCESTYETQYGTVEKSMNYILFKPKLER